MKVAAPRFEAPDLPSPVKLARVASQLKARGASVDLERYRIAAERYLASRRTGASPPPPSRRVLRALAELFPLQDDQGRQLVLGTLLTAATPWTTIWSVWQVTRPEERGRVADHLATVFTKRCKRDRRFAQHRLPRWLPTEPSPMRRALLDPRPWVSRWLNQSDLAPHQLPDGLQASLEAGVVADAVAQTFSTSPAWVRRSSSLQLTEWAHDRGERWRAVVADAALLAVGHGATGAGDVQQTDESRRIRFWVLEQLGHPDERMQRWERVSARAQQVFRWLLLRAEFDRILQNFRERAERDRADFWARYLHALSDAHYLTSQEGIGVCLMRVGSLVAIEFGQTGNACYFYRAEQAPSLRQLVEHSGRRPAVGAFKRTDGLDRGALPYIKRLSHFAGWETPFSRFLEQQGGTSGRVSERPAPVARSTPRLGTSTVQRAEATPRAQGARPGRPDDTNAFEVVKTVRAIVEKHGPITVDGIYRRYAEAAGIEMNRRELRGLDSVILRARGDGLVCVDTEGSEGNLRAASVRLPSQNVVVIRPKGDRRPREVPLPELAAMLREAERAGFRDLLGMEAHIQKRYGLSFGRDRSRQWLESAGRLARSTGARPPSLTPSNPPRPGRIAERERPRAEPVGARAASPGGHDEETRVSPRRPEREAPVSGGRKSARTLPRQPVDTEVGQALRALGHQEPVKERTARPTPHQARQPPRSAPTRSKRGDSFVITRAVLDIVRVHGPLTVYGLCRRYADAGARDYDQSVVEVIEPIVLEARAADQLCIEAAGSSRVLAQATVRLPHQGPVNVRPKGDRALREIPLAEIASMLEEANQDRQRSHPEMKMYLKTRYGLTFADRSDREWLRLAHRLYVSTN